MQKIILTGLNGYGGHFVEELLHNNPGTCCLSAVISRNPEQSPYYEELIQKGIAIFSSLEECLTQISADLAIITTPMHIHYKEVMCALNHNVSVYCEKPLAPTVEECIQIKEKAREKGCIAAVGFQWSFSKGILSLKKDILNERYGKLEQIKTIANWNRPKAYFTNSSWKGRYFGENGERIMESVISNNAIHFLHNILFLCGESMETAAEIACMEGEAFRAHHIEVFDTVCLRMKTEKEQELLFYASIVSKQSEPAAFQIHFEHAVASYPVGDKKQIQVVCDDGNVIWYDSPDEGRYVHYQDVLDAIRLKTSVTCDANTVLPSVKVVNTAMKKLPINDFPLEMVKEDDEILYVPGLQERLNDCYEHGTMLGDQYYPWAIKTRL
ncbi:MAG: Gfo/Idh/MocA family oxidoreductase [Lachnospiraceae bacterium]|nr:Gfo/Idh/MocA family oxidoreductase [Lachnospiraceae bacterium]